MIDLSALPGLPADVYGMAPNKLDLEGECLYHIEGTTFFQYVPTTWRNGRFIDPNTLLMVASSCHIEGADFNDQGIGAGVATFPDGQSHGVVLAQIEMMVDGNRDGVLDEKDYGSTTQGSPFRFWLNNDHDVKDAEGAGEELSGAEDSADDHIQSKRDLEDFARLDINLGAFRQAVLDGQIKLGIKWNNTGGTTPSIKIWRNVSPNGGTAYLTDSEVATQHVNQLTNPGVVQGMETYVIPHEFWQDAGLGNSQPSGHLLFEAVTEGRGQLTLIFQNAQGHVVGEEPGPWLDLKNIRKMYQRGKALPENIAAPNGNVLGPFTGPVGYVDDPNGNPFEADPNEEKKAVIFVHGWSIDYLNYLNFSETMFKRLWHQGFKGRFCSFRWDPLVVAEIFDISVSTGEYNRSEDRAWLYGDALKQFGNAVKGQGLTVSLIGHSMGNIVCGSSLQKGLTVQNYVMMEAAVPAGCYDTTGDRDVGGVNGYARFWNAETEDPTPDYNQIPNGELTAGYRGFLTALGGNVAGDIVNFHNSSDYALATGRKAFGLLEANWEANEEDYKPDGNAVTDWHYHYYPTRQNLDERATQEFTLFAGRYITDSYEMKSFVARPRSKALGAVEGTPSNPLAASPITGSVNMRTFYGFGNQDFDHSGQFNRSIQELDGLYNRIFEIVR